MYISSAMGLPNARQSLPPPNAVFIDGIYPFLKINFAGAI
jgi:hypothetical protein